MSHTTPDFVFINNTTDTIDPDSTQYKRKAIRIRAARKQTPASDPHASTIFKSAAKWNRYQARTKARSKAKLNAFTLDTSVLEEPGLPRSPSRANDGSGDKNTDPDSANAKSTPLAKSKFASSDENPSKLAPNMQGAGWVAPFVPLEILNKVYIPLLLNHYLTNLATDIPELDAGTPFILRTRWFPMVITSPATLNIVLLTSASHYAVCHQLHHNRQIQEVLLHLKYQTLTCTNKLIRMSNQTNQSSEGYSDAVIGAVAKMASYEAMFGLPELYHTHMRGLQNMIKMRGGLGSLGLGGLLQRMVLWIDINSAFLLKSTAYFFPTVPLAGHVVLQQPNPSGFLGAS